jgi:hypothetical protein
MCLGLYWEEPDPFDPSVGVEKAPQHLRDGLRSGKMCSSAEGP